MCEIIHVLMKTGKHTGQVVQVLDLPGVVEREGATVRVLLPGLEGVGTIVDQPENN